jgi:hypothetical protein
MPSPTSRASWQLPLPRRPPGARQCLRPLPGPHGNSLSPDGPGARQSLRPLAGLHGNSLSPDGERDGVRGGFGTAETGSATCQEGDWRDSGSCSWSRPPSRPTYQLDVRPTGTCGQARLVRRASSAVWRDATGALVGDWRVVLMGAPGRWVQLVGWGRMARLGEDRVLAERTRVVANLPRAAVAANQCGRVVLRRALAGRRCARADQQRAGVGPRCDRAGWRCDRAGRRCDRAGRRCDRAGRRCDRAGWRCDRADQHCAGVDPHCAGVGRRCDRAGRRCVELVQRLLPCRRQPTAWAFEAAVAVVPTGPRQAVPGARRRERAGDPSARWSSNAGGDIPRLRGRSPGYCERCPARPSHRDES